MLEILKVLLLRPLFELKPQNPQIYVARGTFRQKYQGSYTSMRLWFGWGGPGGAPINQAIVVDNFLTLWALPMAPGSTSFDNRRQSKENRPATRFLPETGCRNHPVSLQCLVTSKYSVTALFGPSLDLGRLESQ